MKHLFIIAMLISSIGFAQDKKGQDIVVDITSIDNSNGKIMVGLYASEDNWLGMPEKGLMGKIQDGKSTVTFIDIAPGVYAISIFHDENDNNELDMNFMGIPKEDNGCSNGAKGFFGPPKWQDAKFEVKNETIIQIIKL